MSPVTREAVFRDLVCGRAVQRVVFTQATGLNWQGWVSVDQLEGYYRRMADPAAIELPPPAGSPLVSLDAAALQRLLERMAFEAETPTTNRQLAAARAARYALLQVVYARAALEKTP